MNFQLQLGKFQLTWGRQAQVAPPRRRSFPGAAVNRLTADWQAPSTSADAELQYAQPTLRNRCRQLERSNDYVRRYLKLVENNVLGARGIGLQMKARDTALIFDKPANDAIEAAWKLWGKKKTASLNERYSWRRQQGLILRTCVREGGCLVRKILLPRERNPFGFTLQALELDYLDFNLNRLERNGNEIRMGIESDVDGRLIAFHIFTRHPGDNFQQNRQRLRIPATEIFQVMLPERLGQTIGLPAMVSSMLRLNMLEGYEEAEVMAAREGACKAGYIENATPENFTGDDTDAEGNQIVEMEPGVIRELDPGQKFVAHDPTHPNAAYGPFVKQVLRGLAAGLGVSYVSLANDLEGVNYSSIRAGLLEEREEWKLLQEWLIEDLCEPVFEPWLENSLAFGAIRLPNGSALPASKLEKFNAAEWKARRWPWVDPQKDIQANVLEVEKGFNSRRNIIAEQGRDIEDVFEEQAEDQKLAQKYKLDFPTDVQKGGAGKTPSPPGKPAKGKPVDDEPQAEDGEED